MNPTRIFCIGKNYAEHVQELAHLGHAPDGDCVVFMKPASCIVPVGAPLKLPRDAGSVHHEAELVLRLDARGAVSHLALGLDLTLRDLQTALKNKGKPWELAKSFDGAAPLGAWTPHRAADLQALEFTCHVNGTLRQHAKTRDMLFPVARMLEILKKSWAPLEGDIIYTGTPAGVGPLAPGDRIELAGAGCTPCGWTCV